MTFDSNEKFLFQEKTSSALIFIYQKEITYISEVSSNIDSTFSHTNKIVKRLEDIGLLNSVFEGRSRFLQLTPRGYFLAKSLSNSLDVYRSAEEFTFPEGYLPVRQEEEILPLQKNVEQDVFDDSKLSTNSSTPIFENRIEAPLMSVESMTLSDRLRFFSAHIKEVYESLIESGADPDLFLRKLGPYDRELKMISREIEKLNPEEASTVELASGYRAAEMQYAFYLGKK